ncbi:MAG TPA: GspH/FimT family pseudopilin [Tepidisphaeraceae bacterium]|nr:GspH/FimT family pseudopilin [Tepidisphaeraceae bacterium]
MTLIEIMAVLVIFAIASAIVLPQFGKHDDLTAASASRELVADLAFAQSRAIATRKMLYVWFDPAAGKYRVLVSIDPPTLARHPVSQAPYEVTLGDGPLGGVSIAAANFDGSATIAFDERGMPWSCGEGNAPMPLDHGEILLKCGEITATLTISPVTGQINVK